MGGKAKAKANAGRGSVARTGATPPANSSNISAAHVVRVHEALKTIRDHPVFGGIDTAEPLTIAQGGHQGTFTKTDCASVLKKNGTYKCAGNLMWLDLLWLANHRVPINASHIAEIQRFYLPALDPPKDFNFVFTIAVADADIDIDNHLGSLQRLSPPEPCHALLFSVKAAIDQRASDSVLQRWRTLFLSASFAFELVAIGEDRFWRAQNLREEAVESGLVVTMTTRQRIYDVYGFKVDKETAMGVSVSSEKVAAFYSEQMKYAKNSERVSKTFVDSAITISKRVLGLDSARLVLDWCDEYYMDRNPFSSVHCLQALVHRAQTPNNIAFAVEGMIDHYRMEFLDVGHFVVSKIKDPRSSYVEILNFKSMVKESLLTEWLHSIGLPVHVKDKLRSVFADFSSARSNFNGYPGTEIDTTWQMGWPQSGTLAAELIDELVYNVIFDGRYRDAIKSKLTVTDFLDYPSIKSRFDDILKVLREESVPLTAAAATDAAVVGVTSSTNGGGQSASATTTTTTATAAENTGFDSMSPEDKDKWEKYMLKIIRTHVRFISDDKKSAAALEESIRACPLGTLKGDPTGLVLYHFDVKKYGESNTRPEIRIAPLRDALYHRLVTTVLKARADGPDAPAALRAGEVAVVVDGGRRGNTSRLLAPWKECTAKEGKKKCTGDDGEDEAADEEEDDDVDEDAPQKPGFVPSVLQLAYTEESLSARRKLVRGTGSIKQIEWAHVIAHAKICLPSRPRKSYSGSSSGDLIQGIVLPEMSTEWHVSWKDKKTMLGGKKHLILVGGKTEGKDDSSVLRRVDTTMTPVSYHSMPLAFYEELMHTFFAKLVVDLSPLDAKFAWAALHSRIGYVGIAFNDEHAHMMEQRLLVLMKTSVGDASSGVYNMTYAQDAGLLPKERGPAPTPAAKPKAKAKAGEKPSEPKAKAKAAAAGAPAAKRRKKAAAPTTAEGEIVADEGADFSTEDAPSDEEVWDPLADD